MKVNGYEITETQEKDFLSLIGSNGISTEVLAKYLCSIGIPGDWRDTAILAASRILERERKAGRVKFVRGKGWVNVKNTTTALKPCPFCGGNGKLHTCQYGEDNVEAYVACDTCNTKTDVFEDDGPAMNAIAAWNLRTIAPEVES